MILCEWRGPHLDKQVVPHPTLDQIEAAVLRLDNGRFNDLYLEPGAEESGTWLCVGGGSGKYLLSGAEGGQRFATLVDPARPSEPSETLVVGGQTGIYPRNRVHTLETALATVRAFWQSGRFQAAGLTWVEE